MDVVQGAMVKKALYRNMSTAQGFCYLLFLPHNIHPNFNAFAVTKYKGYAGNGLPVLYEDKSSSRSRNLSFALNKCTAFFITNNKNSRHSGKCLLYQAIQNNSALFKLETDHSHSMVATGLGERS